MEKPQFNQAGCCILYNKYGAKIKLLKSVWDLKTSKPERSYLTYTWAVGAKRLTAQYSWQYSPDGYIGGTARL